MNDGEHSLNEILSQNLRLIYALRKQSLEEFSSELGIGHTTLQNILHDKSNLTLDTLEVIADHLNLSPLQLISQQYPKAEVACSVLLLETLGMFRPLSLEERKEAAALFCRLMEFLSGPEVSE